MHKKTKILIGSPGTGKTSYLINEIEKLIEAGVPTTQIGFVTYSVVAMEEATERAMKRFNLTKNDIPYFRTLHSMAFRLLGLDRSQTFEWYNLRDFAIKNGMKLSYGKDYNTETWSTEDDKLMFFMDYARVTGKSYREIFALHNEDYSFGASKIDRVKENYDAYKHMNCLIDYTDMLEQAVEEDVLLPNLKYLFIDEAQDLSPIQWKFVEKLASNSDNVLIAGDDKQAINTWNGADVDKFVNMKSRETIVLERSYRVPALIHSFAEKRMNRIRVKRPCLWLPKESEDPGQIIRQSNLRVSQLTNGEDWLVMTRTKAAMASYVEALVKNTEELFTVAKKPPIDTDVFHAVKLFSEQKQNLTAAHEKVLKKFIPARYFAELMQEEDWFYAFTNLKVYERGYVRRLLEKYPNRNDIKYTNCKIRINTIHGSKGAEADNTVIVNKITQKVFKERETNPDAENRVLFVAQTRAKKNLYIISDDESRYSYEDL